MKKRPFGNTGIDVGEVGLGTWQLGSGWGDVPDETAMATMRAAVELGTTFFDTADVYGTGRSETLIGRFLKETKAPIFVATKFGRFSSPGWPENFSRKAVRSHTEASLRRLGVETLDLTQLHCLPPEVLARAEIFESLRELKREGKIRAFGASVESMDEALVCMKQEGLASLQIIFNIFRQMPVYALFEEAKKKNVAILIRFPLASGILGGLMSTETRSPPGRRNGKEFGYHVPPGYTLADKSLRWCLDFDAVTAAIPGAKNPAQTRINARVSSLPRLPTPLHARLRKFYERKLSIHVKGVY
jgi:aryl-alcohol dehydrogenase-like predicted oxidoreductase